MSFSCKLALLWTDTQKQRHSNPRATAGIFGPGVYFSLSLQIYLLTPEDGLAKNRWVNIALWAFCHSNHVLNEHDIIPYHSRRDPEGRNELTTLTHAKDLIHPCFTPAFCASARQSKTVWIRPVIFIGDLAGWLFLKQNKIRSLCLCSCHHGRKLKELSSGQVWKGQISPWCKVTLLLKAMESVSALRIAEITTQTTFIPLLSSFSTTFFPTLPKSTHFV